MECKRSVPTYVQPARLLFLGCLRAKSCLCSDIVETWPTTSPSALWEGKAFKDGGEQGDK